MRALIASLVFIGLLSCAVFPPSRPRKFSAPICPA
jgi:hypothetical protein